MKQKLIAIVGAVVRHFVGGLGIAAVAGKTPTIGDEDITRLIGGGDGAGGGVLVDLAEGPGTGAAANDSAMSKSAKHAKGREIRFENGLKRNRSRGTSGAR